ncbi:MAG: hypothetical protein LC772_05820 [Chloroflexi bacterium]|nr:hypothetical protein [Chloroflexota bacterium]
MSCATRFRFTALAVGAVVLGAAVSHAAGPRAAVAHAAKPQPKPAMTAAMTAMENGLQLSEPQQKKVDALERDTWKRLAAIQSKRSLSPRRRGEQIQRANDAERAGFMKILTQAQTNKYYSLLSRQMLQRLMHARPGVRTRS